MKNSENKIPLGCIYTGEAFHFEFSTDNAHVSNREDRIRGCFGAFTHHLRLPHDKKLSGQFKYYLNICENIDEIKNIETTYDHNKANAVRNATYVGTFKSFHRDCEQLRAKLAEFVDFTIYVSNHDKLWLRGGCILRTNAVIMFQFKEQYVYQIFFVLNLFRRLTQLTSRPYYRLAQTLEESKWHDMSLVEILLLMDSSDINIPNDQRMGQYLFNPYARQITPKSFRENTAVLEHNGLLSHFSLYQCIVPFDNLHYRFEVSTSSGRLLDIPKNVLCENIDALTMQLNVNELENLYSQIKFKKNKE